MDASLIGGAKAAFPPVFSPSGEGREKGIASAGERAMFSQAATRVVLAPGAAIEPLLVAAAAAAIEAAGIDVSKIDRVYGAAVLGRHIEPSPLYHVHHALHLRRDAMVAPSGTNFSGFLAGIILAAEAVRSGVARHVLVLAGARMSPHIDPGSGYGLSIADGAGAVVVGPGDRNVIIDFATDTDGSLYDGSILDAGASGAAFRFDQDLLQEVRDYGVERPPALVLGLLARHGIAASDVAIVAHQVSHVLMDHWRTAIAPGQYIDSFDEHGNATVASIPMTLAARGSEITRPYLVLMSPGPGMHATAVLVRR